MAMFIGAGRVVSVTDVATGTTTQRTTEGFEVFSEWAPDGTALVYTSRRTGLRDVWVMPAGDGEPRQLTRDIRDDWGPTYSRDGRWIA